jgi:hypothetical protein
VEQVSINEVVASTLSLVRRDINLRGIDLGGVDKIH